MTIRPETKARQMAIALVNEAKTAGWLRAVIECKPDGTVRLDASMSDNMDDNDFRVDNLRMGK